MSIGFYGSIRDLDKGKSFMENISAFAIARAFTVEGEANNAYTNTCKLCGSAIPKMQGFKIWAIGVGEHSQNCSCCRKCAETIQRFKKWLRVQSEASQ